MESIKNITILGVGLKGSGISQVALMAGFNVILFDFQKINLDRGILEIKNPP